MKIVVIGSGGVGAYFGAILARAGHELFFVVRGKHLDAIRTGGLTIESYLGNFSVKPDCDTNADRFGSADIILNCVKTYDLVESLDTMTGAIGANTVILPLQNGIESETIVADRFGSELVIGAVAFIGAALDRPGHITHSAHGRIAIGELDRTKSDRIQKIAKTFDDAKIPCKISNDIRRDIYAKMIWNIGFNALSALLNCSANDLVAHDETRQIVRTAMDEWIAVAMAEGIALKPEMAERNIEATQKGGEIIPSTLQDLRRGRRMETQIFNACAVALGEKHNIPTPVNKTLAACASKSWTHLATTVIALKENP